MVATALVVKLVLYLYCVTLSHHSSAKVLAQDHRNDLLVNGLGLVTGTIGTKLAGWVDPLGCIIIALIILTSWVSTLIENIQLIVGKSADVGFLQRVTYIALTHPGVCQVDTCRAYFAGNNLFVEVDIVLPPEMPLSESHDIGEALQIKLESLPNVERAFVHADYETSHKPEVSGCLSLESCIPIFHHQTIDVFRWLGMKRPEDFAAIGVDSPGACQTLALFTRALGRHLNGLPPSFDQLQKQVDMDERVRDGHALERTIQHTVALFDQYTRGPAQHQHQQQRSKQKQSVRWSSNLSVLGDSSSSYLRRSPADRDTTTPPIQEAPQSEQDIPPPYATATSKRKKASILIKRLSLKHRSPRPISMPVSLETHHTSEQHTPPSTANRLSTTLARRFSLHHQNSFPSSSTSPPPVTNPAHQLLQGQQLQHRHQQVQQHLLLQQQYQKRDHALRQRWEKCRSCVILPREEEGCEELPGYRCTVYKMGHVWVKREMDGPATKSRSRTWRKMYIELWGTVLRFYQVKTHRRFSFYYSSGSDAFKKQQEQQERKHRRQQRQRESSSDDDDDDPLACYYLNPLANTSTPSLSSSSEGSGSSPITIATHATYNFIKRSYRYSQQYATLTTSTSPPVPTTPPMDTLSLARAEATRAYDYKKRPHVLRLVIDQGPHLLLRLTSHPDMISWIEHLQAAINISLDLELRPMPKFMTLPSRLSTSGSNDPRTLHLERTREQRYRDQYEMLI
ncbi:hypothetical protein [Absidia glauca]|uniref:PH domain-containing protein n=1 Tax=Absidia glauca TaxID=4829 RepID=A0A163JHZ0_ABSGL|nr:hypothetical protein [Absidia glauca]